MLKLKKLTLPALFLLLITALGNKNIEPIKFKKDVFINGQDGYHTYRIPAMVVTRKGTVLAFCEGRKNSHHDTGDIDLLLKRSTDDGGTWSDQMVVYEDGGDGEITVGNPVPIIEKNSDRIHLFFTRNYKRIFYTKSDDDGLNWSEPKEFTDILSGFDYPDRVLIATGPVHGIEMGTGRLAVPVWVCNRNRSDRYKDVTNERMRSGIIYSDDGGENWKTGGLVPADLSVLHEATVVERSDGALLINMRVHDALYRAESVSKDGGITWSSPKYRKDLPDPTCQASIFRTSHNAFLFVNAAIASKEGLENRKNLTFRISKDEGKSWIISFQINEGPSGYSDLAQTKDGSILCIFENGEHNYHEKISVVKLSNELLK